MVTRTLLIVTFICTLSVLLNVTINHWTLKCKIHPSLWWLSECFRWVASRFVSYRLVFWWSWHINVTLWWTAFGWDVRCGLKKKIALGITSRPTRNTGFAVQNALWLKVSSVLVASCSLLNVFSRCASIEIILCKVKIRINIAKYLNEDRIQQWACGRRRIGLIIWQ